MAPHRFETATGKLPLTRRMFLRTTSGVLGLTAATTSSTAHTDPTDLVATTRTTHTAKLVAEDGAAFDLFGHAVALRGTTALVGALQRSDQRVDVGAAYVFDHDGTGWRQTAKLLPTGTAVGSGFGNAVALGEGVALVGAPGDVEGAGGGSASVFRRDTDGTWRHEMKLLPADAHAGQFFGWTVALSNGTALVGAPDDEENGLMAGATYVFRPDSDGEWRQTVKLLPSDGTRDQLFGDAVALAGETALFGAPADDNENGSDAGATYVFRMDETGEGWNQDAKLLTDDGALLENFGDALAFDGTTALITAPLNDNDNGFDAGAVYVFQRGTNGTWRQAAKLLASDGANGDQFGSAVALDAETAIVGADLDDNAKGLDTGAAYVFRTANDGGGEQWRQTVKLLPADGSDGWAFGRSVALDEGVALIGAPGATNANGEEAGTVYVYRVAA